MSLITNSLSGTGLQQLKVFQLNKLLSLVMNSTSLLFRQISVPIAV